MKKIAIVSAKGGVGKSTISAGLGMALLRAGHPVLGVDLDPQNSLRFHLGEHDYRLDGLSRATLEGRSWRRIGYQVNNGLAVLPYGFVNEQDRRTFEQLLIDDPNWLKRNLDSLPLAQDTIVVIDTPPGPSVYLQQALNAAQLVIVVALADAASYATLQQMERLIETYCTPRDDFIDHAFLVNQFDADKTLCKDVLQAMREDHPDKVVGIVRHDHTVGEALARGVSIIDYDTASPARQNILTWADWITQQPTSTRVAR